MGSDFRALDHGSGSLPASLGRSRLQNRASARCRIYAPDSLRVMRVFGNSTVVGPHFPENHVAHFVNSHPWRISGIVANAPLHQQRRTKLILRVTRLKTEKVSRSVHGQIRVTVYGIPPAFERGDALTFNGRIRAIRNFNNPGAFDYQTFLALKKIWGSAYTTVDALQIVRSTEDGGFLRALDRIRKPHRQPDRGHRI